MISSHQPCFSLALELISRLLVLLEAGFFFFGTAIILILIVFPKNPEAKSLKPSPWFPLFIPPGANMQRGARTRTMSKPLRCGIRGWQRVTASLSFIPAGANWHRTRTISMPSPLAPADAKDATPR